MAGIMQWFQVTCPSCTANLQVRLPEGITSVQCSECKAVFAVQIQPTALAPQAQPSSGKRSRKRKSDKDASAPPRALSAYNVFMKAEVTNVKAEHPDLPHREAFKMVRLRKGRGPSRGRSLCPDCSMQRHSAASAGVTWLRSYFLVIAGGLLMVGGDSVVGSGGGNWPGLLLGLRGALCLAELWLGAYDSRRSCHTQAAERWQASPMNPQNGGERFPALPKEDSQTLADAAADPSLAEEDAANDPSLAEDGDIVEDAVKSENATDASGKAACSEAPPPAEEPPSAEAADVEASAAETTLGDASHADAPPEAVPPADAPPAP